MSQANPYISNNGLRIVGRTSQSVSLAWPSAKYSKSKNGEFNTEKVDKETEVAAATNISTGESDKEIGDGNWNVDGNWFDVQMKSEHEDSSSSVWVSIYRGYGCHYEIDGLSPDSVSTFRMKRNKELEWGSEVVASTDPTPASAEDLNRAVEMNSEDLISRILELTRPNHLKSILSARDRNGMTTLMVACHVGNVSIAEKLIAAGSDINAFSSHTYRTPLVFACIMGRENVAIMLDKHKVDWTIRDKCECTALDYAINGGHLNLVKLAYTHLGPQQGLNDTGLNGWTPLMRATIISDNLDVLRFLVSRGADVNAVDKANSKSVLMSAILAKKPKFVRYLLEQGANPSYENQSGRSCLKIAKGLELREITEMIKKMCEKISAEKLSISQIS